MYKAIILWYNGHSEKGTGKPGVNDLQQTTNLRRAAIKRRRALEY